MKLADNLYINCITVPTTQARVVDPSVAHIMIGDVSGSMAGDLPAMRTQLKLKLPSLVGEHDTVTIIVFSGRGQVYLVCEDMPVRTMSDLSALHATIDKFVRPVGLTGFKEPLQMATDVQARIAAKRPDAVFSLFFMSDGWDNQWSKSEILTAAQRLNVHSATVVEYGPYADRQLLSQMASTWGGEYIYARNFDHYAPTFEQALQKRINSTPRKSVALKSQPLYNVAFAMDGESLYTFTADERNEVMIPAHLAEVYYLSAQNDGSPKGSLISDHALYAALSVFATRMQPKVMYAILRLLGDVAFVRQFQACFGKTRYGDFQEAAKAAVFDVRKRYVDGRDEDAVPRDDVMTVLELLDILAGDKDARLLLDHPGFQYNRIGRKRESAAGTLTDKEKDALREQMEEALESGDPAMLDAVSQKLAEIKRTKIELKFEAWPEPNGYPVRGIKYSSSRANVTIGITKQGQVDISSLGLQSPVFQEAKLFTTRIYRDYALVKDGLVNVATLPVRLSDKTVGILTQAIEDGRLPANAIDTDGETILLYLDKLPVINQSMVQSASADFMISLEYRMLKHQAARKVYKHYLDQWYPTDKGADFAAIYGSEDAAKLVAAGLTPAGFNPKTVAAEASDVYMAKELKVGLTGLSSLPKVSEVEDALDGKGKLTAPKALMVDAVKVVRNLLAPASKELLERMIAQEDEHVQALMAQIARIKAAIIIGQTWFIEAGDQGMEVEKFTATVDGVTVEAKITQREIEVEI